MTHFQLREKLGRFAYALNLSAIARNYNIFNISELKKAIGSPLLSLPFCPPLQLIRSLFEPLHVRGVHPAIVVLGKDENLSLWEYNKHRKIEK